MMKKNIWIMSQDRIVEKESLIFEFINLKELETSYGLSWTAEIFYKGEPVGDVYDNGANIVPSYHFINRDVEDLFIEWAKKYGLEDWKEIDLVAAGLYALSENYAYWYEGATND